MKTRIIIACLTLLLVPRVRSQQIYDLDQLVQKLKSKNSEILKVQKRIERWQVENSKVYHLKSLQVNVQAGQNDGVNNDLFIGVSQPIGSPWNVKRKKEYTSSVLDFETASLFSTEKRMEYELRSAYLEYHYQTICSQLYQDIASEVEQAYTDAQELLAKQEISTTDFLLLEQLHQSVVYSFQHHQLIKSEAEALIAELINEKEFELSVSNAFKPFEYSLRRIDSVLFLPYEKNARTFENQEQVIKGRYTPQLQLGYFYQTLGNVTGFQGLTLGLSVPLFHSQKKQQVQLNQINKEVADIEKNHQYVKVESMLLNCKSYLENNIPLSDSPTVWKKGLEEITLKKKEGEISQLEFVQIFERLIQGKIQHLTNILEYNQTVIKYEFLSTEL